MGANNLTLARAEAKASGAVFYHAGEPCLNGHLAPRRTANGSCRSCEKMRQQSPDGKAKDRAKYLRRADLVKARANKWKRDNPERSKAANVADFHNTRAKRFGVPGTLTLEDVLDVLSSGVCAACGSTDRPSIDHIKCVFKGGHNTRQNLQRLCLNCNSQKHKSSMEEFMARRAAA